jgi:hypothetical protein
MLNHAGTPTAWVSRPDLQYPGVGQYNPVPCPDLQHPGVGRHNLPPRQRPRPNQSLYVHPYRRPTLGSSNPPRTPTSLSPPGRYRFRDQPEHPLSYNPIRPRRPYWLGGDRMVPNPTTISRGPRRRCTRAPENPRVNYPAEVVPYPAYRHNDDRYMQPPTVRDLAYIAQMAAALPSRYCLLTLQQAIWITHHIEENVWPGLLWSQTDDAHIRDAAVHEAHYWIDDLHGGYAYIVEE